MKVIIAGDFCPQQRVASHFTKGDFEPVLGDVKNILTQVDYSIVNFECPVTKGEERPIVKQGPNLCCSKEGVEAVKWAGFHCVTLANNHFLDYGENGVKNTLEACRKNGIDTVGGGSNLKEAAKILYKEIAGMKLAIINCCEHEFSIATEKTAGSNPLNPIQQYYAIKEAKTQSDHVMVIVHGGHEHFQLPSPRMKETYRFFVDAGADAVINHHQHCYSGYEIYRGKPIFYGLGNFCFDEYPVNVENLWNSGFLVELDFGKSEIKYKIYPYEQCSHHANVKMLELNAYDNRLDELNTIISDTEELKLLVDKYYKTQIKSVKHRLEPIQNKFIRAAIHRRIIPSFISNKWLIKLNNLTMCESHHDKLKYYLENI